MFSRITIVVFLVLFLAGCATTGKNTNNQAQQLQNQVQELQARINSLEKELQSRDEEISYLESEIERNQRTATLSKQKTKSTTTQLSVRQIQTALKNASFYKGPIDGKLGQQTQDAIKAFQKAHRLKADGVVGKQTAEKLSNYLP